MNDVPTRLALRELVERYAAYADRRRDTDLAGLFTEDGALVVEWGPEKPRTDVRGRANIAAAMRPLDRYRATRHVVDNQLLTFDGDVVQGETYCTASHVYDTDDGSRVFVMQIRYQDIFVRDGGDWLFRERRLLLDWTEDRPLNS
ncbi:nuclear transport factor 2 family protein [Nocardia yamanashiensis]|uniref:nuclear transport factor 2 family protein n=1 Tax=Nocardia yamanashiensis TaxID=209247 RepID=UPI001E294E87|nr:nuclear transport factor 2 family protein [Nocardia yamanashiensis]UGT43345.1 nuclear transport factor 2 family protein [Nocardia yamanashiensis]